jgi:hypothetical protein
LLGHWKNYDELESNLSLDELMATVNASREKEKREREILAAVNGIDMNEEVVDTDIVDNQGYVAQQEGFGINEGLGHMEMGV